MKTVKNICCLGAGYVGGPTMAVLALNCPDIQVTVVDINEIQISKWNGSDLSQLPVYEPGLSEIISQTRFKNLHFSTDLEGAIKKADIIFISVNTPTKKKGIGSGQASNVRWIESSARLVGKYSTGHTIVVEKSTVPVRTGAIVEEILCSTKKDSDLGINSKSFDVLSNPEFLAEGSAVNDLQNPDRVLIGGKNKKAVNVLEEIYLNWISKDKIIKTNLWSSELSKLSANAFLAQRVSSINAISEICEVTGANISEVSNSIGKDKRIGSRFLKPGPGFGGSCFKKDILSLVYLCEHYGLNEIAKYWEQVISINDHQQDRIFKIIVNNLFGTVSGKKIVVLGFAFKSNTNDTRESPAILICKKLLEEGAFLLINDPKVSIQKISESLGMSPVSESERTKNQFNGGWDFANIIEDSFLSADAAVILCDWDNYKVLDWEKISKEMRQPAWIFDTRDVVDAAQVKLTNVNLWQLGKGSKNIRSLF